ncbi:MAG TPA: response regulator transcription factor [Polyangia bacterium]
MAVLKILIADDHEVVRRGLRALIETKPDWQVVAEAANGREAVDQVVQLAPNIVLMDLAMPELNGIEATRKIKEVAPRTDVLILSAKHSETLVAEALAAGARGFAVKSDAGQELLVAVESLSEGRPFFSARVGDFVVQRYADGGARSEPAAPKVSLTARERQVLQLLAEGQGNKQVAASLEISVKTAEAHRANVMRKLRAQSLSDLVRYAIRNQLVEP